MIKSISHNLQKPLIIVWGDWDNTMMASAAQLYEVLRRTADDVEKKGIHLLTPIPAISTKPHDGILLALFGSENLSKVKPIFQIYYDQLFSPASLQSMQMFPGVKEMLCKLPDAQVFLGIISSHYVNGKADKKDGIYDHLIRNQVDPSKILIIGMDTLEKHGYSPKLHAKPSTASGELALKLWHIDPKAQVIKSIMVGDGKSDMEFAKNMHQFLKGENKNSSCTGILFNTTLNGDPLFSQAEIASFMESEEAKEANETYSDRAVMGYGRLFTKIRNLISPFNITDDMLQECCDKLVKRNKPSF